MDYSDMDQETAKRLLLEGSFFLLLGMPEGTVFGIDLKNWTTAGDFRGIKMIPPGLHYIHYSASNSHGDVAPRTGFIYDFKPREFVVRMWDKVKEDISSENVSEENTKRIRDNYYTSVDKFLAPYPFDIFEKWKSLISNLNVELVQKLTPECGSIRSALELHSCDNKDRPKGEKIDKNESQSSTDTSICESPMRRTKRGRPSTAEEKEDDILPLLKPTPGMEIRYTQIPDQSYPEDATPAEITKHCMDQSYMLELMIQKHKQPIDIIGELQFTYVCFLIGHSLDAFEQWKKLVVLLCSCENAIKKYRFVYLNFINSLEIQITEIPEEFLADIVMNNNIIYIKLREFFRTVMSCEVEDRLRAGIERFKKNLTDKLMWDFNDLEEEDDDDKPVVVTL